MERKIIVELNNDTQLELVQQEDGRIFARWVETSTNEVWSEQEVDLETMVSFMKECVSN